MNLGTFRLRIQATTGLAAASAGHYEQSLVDGWVNEGVEQFLLRTKAVKKTAALALTPGQGDYTIDPGILALEDLSIGERMLQSADTGDIRRWRLNGSGGDGEVNRYAYESQTLMLYPTPAAPGQLHIVYVQKPTPMTDAAHDPAVTPYGNVPSEYHPIIEAYAKWKGGEYSNDAPTQNGAAFKNEFEQGIVQTKVLETRKAGVMVPRAIPGWKSKQGAVVAPGIDTGA
jgi:hypothetical protein